MPSEPGESIEEPERGERADRIRRHIERVALQPRHEPQPPRRAAAPSTDAMKSSMHGRNPVSWPGADPGGDDLLSTPSG